jgi:hypothetical protein
MSDQLNAPKDAGVVPIPAFMKPLLPRLKAIRLILVALAIKGVKRQPGDLGMDALQLIQHILEDIADKSTTERTDDSLGKAKKEDETTELLIRQVVDQARAEMVNLAATTKCVMEEQKAGESDAERREMIDQAIKDIERVTERKFILGEEYIAQITQIQEKEEERIRADISDSRNRIAPQSPQDVEGTAKAQFFFVMTRMQRAVDTLNRIIDGEIDAPNYLLGRIAGTQKTYYDWYFNLLRVHGIADQEIEVRGTSYLNAIDKRTIEAALAMSS